MKNVAIIGSRGIVDKDLIFNYLDKFLLTNEISCVISGGAKGPDSIGENWAKSKGIPTKIFYPNWNLHGKRAGFLRNNDIISNSDIVIAFWDGVSKGTLHSINLAKEQKKEIEIININKELE